MEWLAGRDERSGGRDERGSAESRARSEPNASGEASIAMEDVDAHPSLLEIHDLVADCWFVCWHQTCINSATNTTQQSASEIV